jgi:hypothetical protein
MVMRSGEDGAAAYTLKGQHHLVPTMTLVDVVRSALGDVKDRLEAEVESEGIVPERKSQLKIEIRALKTVLDDDDRWHSVATDTHVLPDTGAKLAQFTGLRSPAVLVTRDTPNWEAMANQACAVVVING